MTVQIIAEAGVAHNGNLNTARKMADTAREAGADVCKYQTYLPHKLFKDTHPDRLQLEKLALNNKDFITLAKHCEDIGIEFMSTPGELDSLKFLIEECGVRRIKIGSDDLTYKPLTEAAYASGKPVILSTGMATLEEVGHNIPDMFDNETDVTLLHCVSLYPCPAIKANLRAMDALRVFGYPVGYSDHTAGLNCAMLAVALGACIIEKHFCPKGHTGVDAEVSLTPEAFKSFVNHIKTAEAVLGSGIKKPCAEELKNIPLFRKGTDGLRE